MKWLPLRPLLFQIGLHMPPLRRFTVKPVLALALNLLLLMGMNPSKQLLLSKIQRGNSMNLKQLAAKGALSVHPLISPYN